MERTHGVLRIEREDRAPGCTVLRLAGRLRNAELETLRGSVGTVLDGERHVEIDLSDLGSVNEEGASLLCALRARGVKLTRASSYVSELLRSVEKEP